MLQQLSCKNEIHLGRGFAHGEVLVCAVVWCSASGSVRLAHSIVSFLNLLGLCYQVQNGEEENWHVV